MNIGVIGGGVAGMVAAYRLVQAGHHVSLYEASPYLGGLVRTFDVGGGRLEAFYHHLFSTDTTAVRLIEEMGLGDSLTWRESRVSGLGGFRRGRACPSYGGYRAAQAGGGWRGSGVHG